ncbi:MAG: hypothetical protein FK732_02460, partial [Asgard group archaeon]|nr:hypothetical protein [Asgard group archaeon]
DGIAFVAGGPDGFYTVDVRNPRNPILLDRWFTAGIDFRKLDVNEQFAFCCDSGGIYIFDIQQPAAIKLTESKFGVDLTDCDIDGELLFCSHLLGYAILNVSSVYNSFWESVKSVGMNNCTAISAQRPFIYLVEGDPGSTYELRCYNIRDFDTIRMTEGKGRTPSHYDIHVDGDICLLGAGGWMSVYNCSDPYDFTYPDWEATSSMGVWPYGPYVISAEHAAGVSLYDTTNVSLVVPMSNHGDAQKAWQVTINGDYSYVANEDNLVILRHFESAADTYVPTPSIAESVEVDNVPNGTISEVTLTVGAANIGPTDIEYFVTVNGLDWVQVFPGTPQNFTSDPGNQLMWRAVLLGPKDVSPRLYEITLTYDYQLDLPSGGLSPLLRWILIGAGGGLFLIILIIVIVVVIRKKKPVST